MKGWLLNANDGKWIILTVCHALALYQSKAAMQMLICFVYCQWVWRLIYNAKYYNL